jgi:AcrR family transcriptional regulator
VSTRTEIAADGQASRPEGSGRQNEAGRAAGANRPDGRATRWAGHRDRRRAEFVEAAVRVIERDGPNARVSSITAELGVNRPALYRQFADRGDLDRAVAEHAADLLVAALAPRLQVDRDVDSAIAGAIDAYVDWLLDHPHLYEFVRSLRDPDSSDDSPINRVKNTVVGRTAAIIRDYLLGTGAAQPIIADTLATGLVGLADAAIDRWRRGYSELPRAEVTRTVAAMVRGAAEGAMGPVDQPRSRHRA